MYIYVTLRGTMRIHSEVIGTIAVFQTVRTSSYMFQKEEDDDYDFWDWAHGTDSSILSLEAHRFVTWNQRQTVDPSFVIRLRQIDKQSVSLLSH